MKIHLCSLLGEETVAGGLGAVTGEPTALHRHFLFCLSDLHTALWSRNHTHKLTHSVDVTHIFIIYMNVRVVHRKLVKVCECRLFKDTSDVEWVGVVLTYLLLSLSLSLSLTEMVL